jgi:hypothetical protein
VKSDFRSQPGMSTANSHSASRMLTGQRSTARTIDARLFPPINEQGQRVASTQSDPRWLALAIKRERGVADMTSSWWRQSPCSS